MNNIAELLLSNSDLECLPMSEAEVAKARMDALCKTEDVDVCEPLYAILERSAAHNPGGAAVSDSETSLTYSDLVVAVRVLSSQLFTKGVRPSTVVAVSGRRDAFSLVAFLAIERLGAVYLPIDPAWPSKRVREIFDNSNAATLVIVGPPPSPSASLAAVAAERAMPIVSVHERALQEDRAFDDDSDLLSTAPREDSIRYILYTSGSTGKPKGAAIEHQGMLNHLWAKVTDLNINKNDCIAQTAPLTFDISLFQMLAALLVGGRVHFVDDVSAHTPALLLTAVLKNDVTILELVPSMLAILLQECERVGSHAVEGLRCLIATGEALPPSLVRRWFASIPNVPIVNAYGPTECSDDVTHHMLLAPDAHELRVPIGSPIANVTLHVLSEEDGRFRSCSEGEAGELFVGGRCVGRGYVGDPVRTRASFFQDPICSTATGRLYRTGDVVRRLPLGELDYLGRKDRQIKLHGVRIEIGEIEEVIRQHELVTAAAVVSVSYLHSGFCSIKDGGEKQGVQLIAFICGAASHEDGVRSFLLTRLPLALMPHEIITLPELPTTSNGKVNHGLLERVAIARLRSREDNSSGMVGIMMEHRTLSNCLERDPALRSKINSSNASFNEATWLVLQCLCDGGIVDFQRTD